MDNYLKKPCKDMHTKAHEKKLNKTQGSQNKIKEKRSNHYPHTIYETLSEDLPNGITCNELKASCFQYKHNISQIFANIHNKINYTQLVDDQIREERKLLQSHVRLLNSKLNQILREEISQSKKPKKINTKRPKAFKNEHSQNVSAMEEKNNEHLILILKKELASLTNKLNNFQSCQNKLKTQSQQEKIQQEIRKCRLDITERKRKLILNQKMLNSKDGHKVKSNKQYFDLQQEYIVYSKKKQNYQKKLTELAEKNAQIADKSCDTMNNYHQKSKNVTQIQKFHQNHLLQEHLKTIYDCNYRKLNLLIRKMQRNEEICKKKYYDLLKNYEKCDQNRENLDCQIQAIQKKNQYLILMYNQQKMQLLNKIDNRLPSGIDNQSAEEQLYGNSFLLTQIDAIKTEENTKRTNKDKIRALYRIKQNYKTNQSLPYISYAKKQNHQEQQKDNSRQKFGHRQQSYQNRRLKTESIQRRSIASYPEFERDTESKTTQIPMKKQMKKKSISNKDAHLPHFNETSLYDSQFQPTQQSDAGQIISQSAKNERLSKNARKKKQNNITQQQILQEIQIQPTLITLNVKNKKLKQSNDYNSHKYEESFKSSIYGDDFQAFQS